MISMIYTYIALFVFFISGYIYISLDKKEFTLYNFISYTIIFIMLQLCFKILNKFITI